jgi:hypothetical protein
MYDDLGATAQSGLVSYYRVYGPERFKTAAGRPLGRRALQKKIIEFSLPVIPVGKGDPLIDPVAGDDQLRRYAQRAGQAPRKPGRPPKAEKAAS